MWFMCVCVFIPLSLSLSEDIKQKKKKAWNVMKASEIQPAVDKWDLNVALTVYMLLENGKWPDIYSIRQVFNNHIQDSAFFL